MNDLEDSSGSVNDEYSRYMNSTEAKVQQFKEEVSQIWTSLISSDLTKGVMDSVNNLIKLFGDGKLVLAGFGLVLSSIFKGKVGNDLFTSFTNLIQKIIQARQEGKLLSTTISTIGKTQLLLGGITTGLMVFDLIKGKINETKEEMANLNKETIEGFTKSSEEISNAENLLSQKQELESKLSDNNLTSSQQVDLKQQLYDVERKIADILPDSTSLYDEQGRKIADNTQLIKEQIEAKKQALVSDASKILDTDSKGNFFGIGKRDNFTQIQEARALKKTIDSYNNSEDNTFYKYTYSSVTDIDTGIKHYKDKSKEMISDIQNDYDDALKNMSEKRLAILQMQSQGIDNEEIGNRLEMSVDSFLSAYNELTKVEEKAKEVKNTDLSVEKMFGNTDDIKLFTENLNEARNSLKQFGDDGLTTDQLEYYENKLSSLFKDTFEGQEFNVGSKIYDIGYALSDLQKTGDLSATSISNLAKALPNLDLANMSTEERIKALTDALNEQQKVIEKQSGDSIKTAQATVTSSIEQYSKIAKYQEQLSENGGKITLDLAKEFSDTKNGSFTDFMGNPEDMNQISEYFKNKMQEIANSHAEAMDTLKANDQSYYQEVLATGDLTNEKIREWASHFMDVNSESYHFDLNEYATVQQAKQGIIELLKQRFAEVCSNMTGIGAEEYEKDMGNYTTIQQAKQGVAQKLGQSVAQFLSDTLKIGADSYELDFKNFKSVQEAKAECLKVLGEQFDAINKKIGEDWVDLNVKYKNTIEGIQENHPWTPEDQKNYKQQLESQLRNDVESRRLIAEKMEEIRKLEVPDLDRNLSDLNPLDKIDTGNGKGNKDNKKDTQKTISLIETEIDRYKTLVERIKAYQNAIEQINTEKENKSIAEQNNMLLQQIGLYNQLKQAQINLRNAKQNRLNELRGILASNGFSFENNGVIHNYTQQLEAIKQAKNALIKQNPDNKDLSKQFEKILSYANEYDTLITSDIPSLNKEISDIWNKIVSINKEILSNKAKEYLDKKQEYIDKELESIEKINEQREKENNLLKEKEELLDKQKDVAKAEQKLEEAKRTNDYELIKKRQEELEEAQKANNDTIYEQNYSAGTERLNDEKEYLNDYMDKLKEALSDENLLKLAQRGINDLTPTLNSLGQLSDKIPETFNDINNYTSNLTNEFSNFNTTLDEIQKKLSNINTLNIPNLNTGYIRNPINKNNKSVTVNKIEINNTINGGDTQEVTKKLNELNNGLDDRIVNKIGQLLNN